MDDALLMRVLHGVADLLDKVEPLPVLSFRESQYEETSSPVQKFHHEVGTPVAGHARVEDPRDVGWSIIASA